MVPVGRAGAEVATAFWAKLAGDRGGWLDCLVVQLRPEYRSDTITVMNRLAENYEWLFDGFAGAAIIAVIGYLIHYFQNSRDRRGTAALTAQGATVTNSPVASGSGITQTVNAPTINLSLLPVSVSDQPEEVGCDFWLEFHPTGSRALRIQNNGAEPAYDVVVQIPADGSGLKSDVINRLDNDRNWVVCCVKRNFLYLESVRTVIKQTILRGSADGEKIPVLITYRTRRQQGCEGHLEIRLPLQDGIQFSLPSSKQNATRPAWPEQKGAWIATSSETIPDFPGTLTRYRFEENKDFWNRPFPVRGRIRLFEGSDWQGIPNFPHTMNGCSAGVFMIRWRSADPDVRVQSSLRYSSASKSDDEKTGIFGYMFGTNCDQPMFKIAGTRNGSTLVDVYYELKFWQAAP